MRKYLFYIIAAWLWAGVAPACSDEGGDEPLPPSGEETVAPDEPETAEPDTVAAAVAIQNLSWTEAVLPGRTVRLRANIMNSRHATLQWYVDGAEVSTDTTYEFSAESVGTYRVKVTATIAIGSGSDSLNIRVMEGFGISDIENWTGEGTNEAVLAIQWVSEDCADLLRPADDEVFFRAWGYRWTPGGEDVYGIDMIEAVVKSDPRLFVILSKDGWGTAVKGFGYDGDGDGRIHIRNSGHTETGRDPMSALELTEADFTDGIYWQKRGESVEEFEVVSEGDWWAGGWYTAYLSYWVGSGEAVLEASDYSYSSLYASERVLEHQSWDAWTFSPINTPEYNVAPQPGQLKAAPANN